ncbi:MAG: bifunctional hydroxymethylpyrimidine kinase/phosphomethylpyrimidine kinase [Bacteroidota bacterium]
MQILLVHSLASHGTASMKAMMSVLGTRVLPVPSLLLTGLTNVPGHQKVAVDLEPMIKGALEIARQQNQRLVLYIGYLGEASQVDILVEAIDDYREAISKVIVDPVSGDHGRLYVKPEIVKRWPDLLSRADWAFPNFTELSLYAGFELGMEVEVYRAIEAFEKRFPDLSFVATSIPSPQQKIGLFLKKGREKLKHEHERLAQNFGGTGDVFAAYFILYHLIKHITPSESLILASNETCGIIRSSIEAKQAFLQLFPKE